VLVWWSLTASQPLSMPSVTHPARPGHHLKSLTSILALGLTSLLAMSAGAAAARAVPVTISPLPGTLDASAQTQISLLGAPAGELRDIRVVGSRTGSHAGRLEAYTTGDGASFLPRRPFAAGELVSVRAEVLGAGAPRVIVSHFRIAHQVHVPGGGDAVSATAATATSSPALQSFHSRPDLRPPAITVTTATPGAAPGDLFVTPSSGPGQDGPLIFDDAGQVVWFKPAPHGEVATDLQVQGYDSRPVLTWWQGNILALGFGQGEDVIYDDAYRRIGSVKAGNGFRADLHEFRITPQGTALITVFDPVRASLASVGGTHDGTVLDGVIQEIDIKTGLVMFEWHSLHRVALSDSYAEPRAERPLDYFHINSIEQAPDGDFLISARNTWAAYEISHTTGAVLWRLGGKRSSFAMGPGTRTAYQHDARLQSDGTITLFDDGAVPRVHPQSRGVRIRLDYQHKTATLVRRYEHPSPLISGSQGNLQTQPDGNALIGWGAVPVCSEFNSAGALVFDAHLQIPTQSYRAFRFPWSAQPTNAPAVAVGKGAGGAVTVYASYNGATNVASWEVLAGPTSSALTPVETVPRSGFETSIPLAAAQPYVAVRALDGGGQVLGTSPSAAS
jgi:hypothetical protein